MGFSDAFANVYGTISQARNRRILTDLEAQLQPLRVENLNLINEGQRFQNEQIAPLDLAIRQLQEQQDKLNLRATKFGERQRAGLEAQYPWLPLVNAIQPAAVQGISTLAALQKEQETQQKAIDAKHDQLEEAKKILFGINNEQKALHSDVTGVVDSVLGQLETDNPGLTFSTRERSSLADLASQKIGDGAISLDDLPGALGSFLANNPRVQNRLANIVPTSPATIEPLPGASAAASLQALQAQPITGVGDVMRLQQATQAAQQEAQQTAITQRRTEAIAGIQAFARAHPAETANFFTSYRNIFGANPEETLRGMDQSELDWVTQRLNYMLPENRAPALVPSPRSSGLIWP